MWVSHARSLKLYIDQSLVQKTLKIRPQDSSIARKIKLRFLHTNDIEKVTWRF